MSRLIVAFLVALCFPGSAHANNDELLQKVVQRAVESESDSLVIIQNGHVLYSNFFGGSDRPRSTQSVTKSVCAIAIGILLDEGKIASLDLPMSTWISSWVNDPDKSKITLRMIMNHTSGLPDSDESFWKQQDLIAAAANTPLTAAPGSRYLYSNIGASLLQTVIAQAAQQEPSAFVAERIFKSLGITDAKWTKDKTGHEATSGGLHLSTADLVKIGVLMLGQGSYEGHPIISQETMHLLVTKSQPFADYGLLWWLDRSSAVSGSEELFSANGWGGQYITIFRSKGLIAVRTKDPYQIDESKFDSQEFGDFRSLISQWE